jgi:peptide/nickel transport system permease protein
MTILGMSSSQAGGSGPATTAAVSQAGQAVSRLWRAVRGNRKAAIGATLLVIFTFLAVFPWLFTSDNPEAEVFGQSLGPSAHHLFGTTSLGQDLFAQFVWGARETLIIAVVSGLLSTLLSVTVGLVAAYLGGVPDAVLSYVTDVLLVLPTFPLLIIIAAFAPNGGVVVLIGVLVITGYSYGARQLRSQALSMRHRDFLEAARVRGERSLYIVFVEIIPTLTSLIVATFLGTAVYNVIFAAGLQFIGFGNPSSVSWGTMLYWAQNEEALQTGQYLWAIVPGVCIALLGAAFALLNYAFDEIGNPALRPVRKRRRVRTSVPGAS